VVPRVLLIFLSVFLLQGCALPAPYPDWMLKNADPYISSVEYLSYDDLQKACDYEVAVSGCVRLLTGEIFILDEPSWQFRDCVLRHERSHLYDVYVRNFSISETQKHAKWVQPRCYVPRRVASKGAAVEGV
jgi:hypothetical protein